ncbi:unnamed protein product [Closterium sp. NIES-54]
MATTTVLRQWQPSVQESLSPQQLREWAIWWGSPGDGASHARAGGAGAGGPRTRRREPLSSQQLRKRAVRWGSPGGGAWCAITGGPCESTPAGSATGRRGGSGGGQQRQQRPPETLSPQQLHEWAVRWGSPGGGAWGTSAGGGEAPGGIEAASLGAFDSASTVPVPVTLADPSEGPVVARGATDLPCPAAPSGLLIGLHLPSFAKNLVATSVLQDQWVIVTQPGGELVAICTDSRTGEHLATFTQRPRSGLYTLTTESALVAESGQVDASVEVAASCSCRLLTHQTLQWHHLLGHPSLPHLRGMDSCFLDFSGAEGIRQTFTLPASPQQNGIAERRIGLVMEVVRTSIVHAAAPHFLWPFAVRYVAEQLNLWPRVSHPETSPTLRWMGEVGDASLFWVWGALLLVRNPPARKLSPRTIRCVFLGFPTDAPGWQFYHPGSHRVLSSQDVTFEKSGPAPSGVSQVDPSPLVELVEVSSETSGPAEGGDPTPAATVTPRRSARLAVPPGFPPRLSSPPLQLVAVDSGAAGGGTTEGAGSGGAECPLGTGGTGGTGAGGPGTSRQEALLPDRLREWVVQWGSPGGGASRLRAGGDGTTGAGGAGTVGARGSATGGTGVASAGGTGARWQETLSPERLCEWAVQWGSSGGGASRARTTRAGGAGTPGAAGGTGGAAAVGSGGNGPGGASAGVPGTRDTGTAGGTGGGGAAAGSGGASPGGASAGVPGTRDTGAAGGTGGAGATGGTGGAGPGGASTGGLGVGRAGGTGTGGGADTGGTTGGTTEGTGDGGASQQESLSPLQLRGWAVRWGSPGGGAGGTGSKGAVATGAGGSGGATIQPQPSALCRLLSLPPGATEFPPQLLPGSPLPAPAPHTEVIASLTARREHETRASTHERRELETRASVPARVHRVRRPRGPAVPGTHDMTLRPSSVPQGVVLPEPPASSLPHVPDPESNLVRAASRTVTRLLATVVSDPSFESAAASAFVDELVEFAALCRLDYAASLVFDSSCPPSVGGELDLGCDVLVDMQSDLECLAAAAPHLASTLLCPEGDPDALDIPTPRTYAEAITAQHDYELHSLDFSTAFLQGSLHEAIWLRHPRGFNGSFPEGTQCSLQRPVYGLQQPPREWHDTLRTTLAALGFAPSTADPSLFLRTDTSLPPFYVLVSTRLSSILSSSCEAEIYAGAMAAQELRWLTYLLTDLGERPHSPPILYVDNKAMIALCQDQRLEHKTKHIALRYFLTRELQQCA